MNKEGEVQIVKDSGEIFWAVMTELKENNTEFYN